MTTGGLLASIMLLAFLRMVSECGSSCALPLLIHPPLLRALPEHSEALFSATVLYSRF